MLRRARWCISRADLMLRRRQSQGIRLLQQPPLPFGVQTVQRSQRLTAIDSRTLADDQLRVVMGRARGAG